MLTFTAPDSPEDSKSPKVEGALFPSPKAAPPSLPLFPFRFRFRFRWGHPGEVAASESEPPVPGLKTSRLREKRASREVVDTPPYNALGLEVI